MVTEVDTDQSIAFLDGSADIPNGITFNPNGTKMFVSFQSDFINEYNLSTPFDISTHTYAGDGERCNLATGWSEEAYEEEPNQTGDLTFSSDGLYIFVINRGLNTVMMFQLVHWLKKKILMLLKLLMVGDWDLLKLIMQDIMHKV